MDVNEPSARCVASPHKPKAGRCIDASEWQFRSLGEVAEVSSGGTPSRRVADYWDGGISWVTTTEIDFQTVTSTSETISRSGLANSAAKLLKPGAILMALYGQGKTRGKVALLGIEAATNQACAAIRPLAELSNEFLFRYLESQYSAIRALSNGGNQDNLTSGIVKGFVVPVPAMEEQASIARAVGDAARLVDALAQLIAKKRQIKQGAMQELLTGKKRLPGFDREWTSRTLGEVANFSKGRGLPKSEASEDGSVPCIHYGELFTFYGALIQYPRGRTKSSPQHLLSQTNDVLMPTSDVTPSGLAKASCLLASEVVLGGDILVIRPFQGTLHGPFLAYLL